MTQQSTPTAQSFFKSGVSALQKGNMFEAEQNLAQAISLDEKNPAYWEKLGLVWAKTNRHGQAVEAFDVAISLAADPTDLLYNKALSLTAMGDEQQAVSCLEQSFKLSQSDEMAENLADIFIAQGNYQSAAYYLLHIYKKKKALTREDVLGKLATTLFRNGDIEESRNITVSLLKRFPDKIPYIELISDIYRRTAHTSFDADSKSVIENLLKRDTTKFIFFRNPWTSLFLLDPEFKPLHIFVTEQNTAVNLQELSKTLESNFLCLGLQRGLATSIPIENILTNIRKYFLLHWQDAGAWPPKIARFLASLAATCWHSDYVFFESPEEKEALSNLKKHIQLLAEQQGGKDSDAAAFTLQLCLLACYVPLYTIYDDESAVRVDKRYKSLLEPLIKTQITNPKTESRIAAAIPSFTTVDDAVSLSVQEMYTSRPYPRWLGTSVTNLHESVRAIGKGIEVLVAGCGTGHEPALYANTMPEARITAIDLSRTSIAYGQRMVRELGIDKNITFMQGDLMKVSELGKHFDFITSSGVLHHLKDPEKGLKAISAILKPQGRMSISLYSRAARDYALNPALDYIKEKGYSSSLDDMRQFRRDVMFMPPANPATRCTATGDFYSLSECNDLLFHVQEHRYSPSEIWDMGKRHGLEPFHISMTSDRIRKFREIFPDGNALDPQRLEEFEKVHPLAFSEMFKVFFRHAGDKSEQPIDFLIFKGLV